MKQTYEKPRAEIIDFQAEEDVLNGEGSILSNEEGVDPEFPDIDV